MDLPVHPVLGSDRSGAPDAAIVRRMAAGDQGALRQLVSRHGGGLQGFCLRFLGNAADAEEVVQDVFFRAWRFADRYRPETATVATWLYGMAVNRCIDRKRSRALRAFVGLGTREDTAPSEAPDPLRQTEGRDALEKTRAAIADLPDRQRLAILLGAAGGLDNASAADAMGIRLGAYEQLLVRARRTLRTQLDP
ncbi:sigma-70 family RNA polymerase sigma factor [Aurantimonas aggregata]|uniref:Sigma-70 family RNA polymerase sigma factor n=1 Tax=Aurantimonas aggregata TaxID=2047720 RepID=A0A6L9MDH9_9HYPH|nr:sigma-70 family RNA polymerase sigma factor [Aurantimonas aggregata]NDV85894.1 sigma-70 family RNA polymerase sigma factor [Aurantimonas aggregata]